MQLHFVELATFLCVTVTRTWTSPLFSRPY